MKIDATTGNIKVEMTAVEAKHLLNDIGDLNVKVTGTKLRQYYQQLYATLKLRRLLDTG
jgi:hypothetical protein